MMLGRDTRGRREWRSGSHESDEAKSSEAKERFPHPFVVRAEKPTSGLWAPRAIVELKMYQLSATLREKPDWWRKAMDPEIRQKWFEEAKTQQADVEERWRLTDNMINYTLGELEGYAALRDDETGIECGPYDRIWSSEKLIPDEMRAALQAAVKPLEDVPENEKDWHPGSNDQVLDLVHPSLYPLVYMQTYAKLPDGNLGTIDPPDLEYDSDGNVCLMFISERFQWLPSDFAVRADGSVALVSPYINNIAPAASASLVPALERIMARAVPMWERVLSDLRRGEMPVRLGPIVHSDMRRGTQMGLACIWPEHRGAPWPDDADEQMLYEEAAADAWYATQPKRLPDSPARYDGALSALAEPVYSLRDRTIQVIVKLANIVLTPEKPEYPGGKWHVEGMRNESIVSTFIYYYDSDNIRDTRLAFRQATAEPMYHEQYDSYCMKTLYGMDRDVACAQDVGTIATKEGRCIAFPNLYQHKVSPFELADRTRPGVRKILVFFLVDPTRRIPSATEVAPQQEAWLKDTLYNAGDDSHLSKLPVELLDVHTSMTPGIMNKEEALKVREQLMRERTVDIGYGEEFFTYTFNMCEH